LAEDFAPDGLPYQPGHRELPDAATPAERSLLDALILIDYMNVGGGSPCGPCLRPARMLAHIALAEYAEKKGAE
jgi:hypothetical protein